MLDTEEAIERQNEIDQVLSQSIAAEQIDEAEIEAELDALEVRSLTQQSSTLLIEISTFCFGRWCAGGRPRSYAVCSDARFAVDGDRNDLVVVVDRRKEACRRQTKSCCARINNNNTKNKM